MLISFDWIINPVVVSAALVAGGLIGFLISRARLAKSRKKILELERDLMNAHEEVLEAQKAYVQLENQLEHSIPVIAMKSINGKENNAGKEKASK